MARGVGLISTLAIGILTLTGFSVGAPKALSLSDLDEGWLWEAKPHYENLPGFIDVAYMSEPDLHVVVLFDGPVPAVLPSLHPFLPTRGLTIDAVPVTHEPLVPFMELLAQGHVTGIRPGAWMKTPHPCTMAHVVQDGGGKKYIMTAGHCADFVGQSVTLFNQGTIGSVAFTTGDGGLGNDYALVEIATNRLGDLNPRTTGWGGPTGTATSNPGVTAGVRHYGWGAGTWYTFETRCRPGVGPTMWGTATYGFEGTLLFGDSGSELQTASGLSVGINTHIGPGTSINFGTRTTWALQEMGAALGKTLTVVNGGAVNTVCTNN